MKRYTTVLLAFASCLSFNPLKAAVPENAKMAIVDFRQVAKAAIPAVVSIQVSGNGDGVASSQTYNPEQFSKDPFWSRFFGKPDAGSDSSSKNNADSSSQKIIGQASGFLISNDGYIVTNSHVIKGADEILVTLQDGTEKLAHLVGYDANTDIGLIKIEGDHYPFLNLGDSKQLEVGEWVVAIGAPLGLQATLTAGIVSAVDRNNLDLAIVEDFIQTDTAINQGNSGGPLLDLTASVVGMNTAIVTNSDGGGYMGIGFAIPSNLIKHIYPQLRDKGIVTRGYIGVTLKKVDATAAQTSGLKIPGGAVISEVTLNSPAEKAGLKPGDIITQFDDRHVKDTATLRNGIQMLSPGTSLKLNVLREGKPINVVVELSSFPEAKALSDQTSSKERSN